MKTLKSYYFIVAFLGVGGVKTRTMVLLFYLILWFDRISAPSLAFIYRISDWENCYLVQGSSLAWHFLCLSLRHPLWFSSPFPFQEERRTQKKYFRHFYWNISNYFSLNRAFNFHYSFTTEKLAQRIELVRLPFGDRFLAPLGGSGCESIAEERRDPRRSTLPFKLYRPFYEEDRR